MTTGALSGTVTDQTGAVVPNVTVSLESAETGAVQTTTSNQSGEYRFSLLKPGHYTIRVNQSGFDKLERPVQITVGQVAGVDLTLKVGQAVEQIEVSSEAPVLSTEPAQSTSFTQAQVELLPSAGGDITNVAFTAPGAVVNVTGGYGNFTVNGLPATSNLFTINGENDMDPYFNINNSGATNLTLGQNEIQEATVISNPYGGQYGQLSGAQVSYVTKSGSNEFHGNLLCYWNGRYLNANDWFNNLYGAPRPFANANQWAGSIGGRIIRDRTFFFVDNEGLRFVLPNVDSVTIPTPAFANAVLNNIQKVAPVELPMYQKMFNLWANAPGAASARPIPNSDECNALSLAGFDPTTQACAAKFQATPTALASEWILAFRIDQKISDKDQAYFRYKQDRGTQPTSISPISSNFNAISKQPSWDTQLNETHIFGPRATNSFMATLSYYRAIFEQNHQLAASTFPVDIITSGSVPFTGFNSLRSFPQGRNITQYQFIDDYTLTTGVHNLKFGANFRRYDVSDHNFFWNSPGVYFGYTADGLDQFANGLAYQYRESLNQSSNVPIAMWGLGLYAMDEWSVKPNFKLTLALRAERNSNPVCQHNCFANFKTAWNLLPSVTSADPTSVPYSSDIIYNQHQAYPGVDTILWSPRIGFSWAPGASRHTVLSGGFGIFYDSPPAGLVDNLIGNPPASVNIRVRPVGGTPPFDPAGAPATWSASANAFSINKTYTEIASELSALGAVFAPPAVNAIVGKIHAPEWQEWNFQVQQQLNSSTALVLNYAGNHGVRIPYLNQWANAYDVGYFPGIGLPTSAPVPNYGVVTLIQNGAISNYNGLTVTLSKRFSHGFAGHFNYTWSHNLDEASNGGIFTYGDSLLGQINPFSLRASNYGNSDYDIRHNLNADVVYNPGFHFSNHLANGILGGWQLSFKIFWRTGLPFSVTDNNVSIGNFGDSTLAGFAGNPAGAQSSCGAAAAVTPCINAAAFINSGDPNFTGYTSWPNSGRNAFRGPHYFNADASLFKTFSLTERLKFGLGVQAFNVLNHPNFGLPDYGLGDATFGLISTMASTPTSPYGNFLGFDSSPRVVQVSGKITF